MKLDTIPSGACCGKTREDLLLHRWLKHSEKSAWEMRKVHGIKVEP